MIDKKVAAISIMRVMRAAIDVRLIEKPVTNLLYWEIC